MAAVACSFLVLLPGVAWAPWRGLDDEAFSDEKLCRDGGRFVFASGLYTEHPEGLAIFERDDTPTNYPVFSSPPPEDTVPPPPAETVVFDDTLELKFAPVHVPKSHPDDTDIYYAYTVYVEAVWKFALDAGAEIRFDFNPPHDDADLMELVEHPVVGCLLDRSMDVKPERIDPADGGRLKVTVLTSEFINAGAIDASTVRFGPADALPRRLAIRDLDGDGDADAKLAFSVRDAGIACGDETVLLQANTTSGGPYRITEDPTRYQLYDSIVTVGC